MTGSVGQVETQFFTFGSESDPFVLKCGSELTTATLAYETYGTLNEEASNAVLVFHALTGSQHAAGYNPRIEALGDLWATENHHGWWDGFIGPGKPLDTNKYLVICANYLGGCYGSTGPASIDPVTGRPYGGSFPEICFADMVDSQVKLLEHLGVSKLHAVTGGSTGGVMALSLATRYPDLVDVVIPFASGVRTTALQRIHNYEQINAIQTDPNFNSGDYYDGPGPAEGLSLARMISHKTFVSLRDLRLRARDEVLDIDDGPGYYGLTHPLESYMRHQGDKFVKRFDANSYLRLMHAWQTYDLVAEAGLEDLSELFTACKNQRYMVFTIDSDVCFYPDEQQDMVRFLEVADVQHRWITVHSDKGHDSFLLEPELYAPHLVATLEGY